jgi:hypothetical protein
MTRCTLVVPATPDHAARIVPLMAHADRARLAVAPAETLALSVFSWCALRDGEPMCVGGVTRRGIVWMVSTPELHRQKKFFVREGHAVMARAKSLFAELRIGIETCYPRSLRWMAALGFHATGAPILAEVAGRAVDFVILEWRA